MYGHVITKFSGMGRFTYPWCSAGGLRPPGLRYKLRWLDWIFWEGYLPSLSIDHVAMSKDREKRLPQMYYIKMKISYDLSFISIGVAMERNDAITFFMYLCVSLYQEFF